MNSLSVHNIPPTQSLADDLMKGAEEIGKFIGESTRCTYYLLEKGELPAFKQGFAVTANDWFGAGWTNQVPTATG